MSVKVQKYLVNLGKSVAYTTADVLSEKFTYVNEFKNENQEVFKEAYHSIKDYKTTFSRIKNTITDNKIMDAARVGFDSIVYSVTTGDFYAKNKETEVLNKYGGSFMQGMDMDDDDFDFGNDDVTDGDKVIATAVKKNSKLQTAITTEAIVKTGKAQMDVSKENAMLLYTQNERLLNKLDGGLENITGFLKQNAEQTAKVQNQMNENLNKFMANVDNNVTKITKQMDELLEMQRNLYSKQTTQDDGKKKPGYDDILGRGGILNIKEYGKNIGKNISNMLESIPGFSMLLGNGGIEGSNLLATMLANPTRELSKVAVNKALGKGFDNASKALNKTLENLIPSLIAKANAASKKDDAGLAGMLGKIFGIKTDSTELVDPNKYVKGPIPFDGITKKAIIDVIPYYLRKMTSAMTGGEEMTFDYTTGRWSSMRAAKKEYDSVVTSAQKQTEELIKGTIQAGTNRSFESMYASKNEYDKANVAVQSLALKLQAAGDFGSIRESDLTTPAERALYASMKKIFQRSEQLRYERDTNGKPIKMRKGFNGPDVSSIDNQLLQISRSQNSSIKQLNETGGIAMLAAMEGITGDAKYYHGKSYVDYSGDMNERHIQEMPTAQILLRAKDEYGVTLYQYLRSMGNSLNTIRAYSSYLRNLTVISANNNTTATPVQAPDFDSIINENNSIVDYKGGTNEKYTSRYYQHLEEEAMKKNNTKFEESVEKMKENARKKGKDISFITDSLEYQSKGDKTAISRLINDYYGEGAEYESKYKEDLRKEEDKKKKEQWKKIEEIAGKETTDKLKKADANFDKDKGLSENLAKAGSTTEKILIMGKWFAQKTNLNVMDKVTGTIVKTDAWLRNLIYGEDLKADDQKKSLWQLMKGHTSDFFKKVQNQIGEFFGKIKESKFYQKLFSDDGVVTKAKKKVFGNVDTEGNILEEGVLSHFTAGFRKGMTKNADDVHKMWKEEIAAAKRAAEKLTSSSDSSNTISTNNSSQTRIKLSAKQIADKKKEIIDRRNARIADRQKIGETDTYDNPSNKILRKLIDLRNDTENLEQEKSKLENEIKDLEFRISTYNNYKNNPVPQELTEELSSKRKRLVEIKTKISHNNTATRNLNIKLSKLPTMAAGGVNRTGKPFQSVLSAGEYLNGSKIGQTGIYTIPKGGVVYNPAPTSVRNIQAKNEKAFVKGLRYNANADDGLTEENKPKDDKRKELTPEELAEHQKKDAEARERIKQVDIDKLTDWTTLTDDKQKAAFLGNMASRGVLGGIAGLLVGGPLLGAAVGAASTLSKSTGSFAELIFGDVERDKKTGEIILDSNGNPKRKKDSGLISKELQKAAPDMTKGGMTGLAAGLLTPLGPLGGLLIGSGLGFAKNSEIFQGSLFGDGGVFSDENVDKLKKGAKNMGIGAATAALFLPGPFGLVGSALIGATAGYATSTDKFKDFLLGKEGEDGKRRGGLRGALKNNIIDPFKGFGKTIVDKTMDEIFGKKGDDDKRQGGLFGAIRENVITPMTSGAQSIFKELTNTMSDIKDFTLDIMKKIRANAAGNDLLGGIWEKAGKVSSGVIGLAGKAGRFATKPFRLLGDEGIGGKLKAKRIRNGRADDMTARERQMYRGRLKMSAVDEWSTTDEAMAGMNLDELNTLNTVLDYNAAGKDIEKFKNNSYDILGQELRKNISRKDSHKVIKMLKEGRQKDVEKWLNTRNLDDATKKSIMKELNLHKSKMSKAENDIADMERNGVSAQQYLLSKGINIDISDEKKRRNLKKMTAREIAHQGVGLTDEEIEFEKEKAFWKGKDSPFNTVNEAAVNMERLLESIHYDLTIGSNYDKLSAEEQAKYGSRNEYINSIKNSRANAAIRNVANGGEFVINDKVSKIGKIDRNSVKVGDFMTNNIYNDYLQFYTGNLKNTMAADNRIDNLINEKVSELIDMACQMFDGLAMKELCVTERVQDDINLKTQKIMANEKCDEDTARSKIKVLTRKITVVRNDKNYDFDIAYSIGSDGKTITPTKRQFKSYDIAKRQFVDDYVADHTPKSAEASYMSAAEILKNSVKFGVYLAPSVLPLVVKDFIKKHAKGIISTAVKGVKKVGFNIGLALGSHELNNDSLIQRLNDYQYKLEAEKAWDKELDSYMKAHEKIVTVNTQSQEVQDDVKASVADKLEFLDYLAKELNVGIDSFAGLSKEQQEQVHKKFCSLYIQAKRDNQVFGRGLLGGIKQIGKRISKGKLGKAAKFLVGAKNILFKPASITAENKEDRKAAIMKTFVKKAKYYFDKSIFGDDADKKTKKKFGKAKELRLKIMVDKFGPESKWDLLTPEQQEIVENEFIDQYSEQRFQKSISNIGDHEWGIEKLGKKLINWTKSAGAWGADKLRDAKSLAKKKAARLKREKFIEMAIKHKDERLDEVAMDVYEKTYNELTDDEKSNVERRFYAKYGYSKRGSLVEQFFRHKIKKVVSNSKSSDSITGTLKSGIRNATAGKLDEVRQWKEKNQEQDTLIGKFFDRMDARQLKKDKEKFEGKKDSKIGKIIKWLFVGGVAAPLIVGFIKEDVLPTIREKVKPWLKKAKDKIFGVKDERTGEYKGGIISGIVNPIRNFFKSKFGKVHDWIHNEGEFNDDNKGFKGFWKGLTKVGEHIIKLWKSGITQIYGEYLPKIIYNVGKNLIPMTWTIVSNIGKGLIDYAKNVFKGKQGALDLSIPDSGGYSEQITSGGETTKIPNTVGGNIQLTTPTVSTNIKLPKEAYSKNGSPITGNRNEDGSTTYTNENTGQQVTSKISGDYYSVGTNEKGQQLYRDTKTNKVYTPDGNGGYVPLSQYAELVDESLPENSDYQHQVELENANELNANYTGRSAESKMAGLAAKIMTKSANMVVRNGAQGAKAMSLTNKVLASPFKLMKHTPGGILTSSVRTTGKIGEKAVKLADKVTKPLAWVHGKTMNAVGKAGDKVTGGAFSKMGRKMIAKEEKIARKNALKLAEKAEKNALKLAEAEKKAGIKALEKQARADKLASKVASGKANFFEKAIHFIKSNINKMKEKIAKVLKNEKIAKIFGKGVKENADEIAEGIAKGTTETIENSADDIAKHGASAAAKGAAKVLSIVMMVADFLIGVDNCRNLLGIVTPKPSFSERLTGGIINIIPDVIMTLAEVITAASFGGAAVVGGILAALSIIATFVISIDSIRDALVGMIINVLDKIPGIDMSKIKEERAQAKSAIEAYNAKNNTNLSIDEYNNLIGNKTVATKIGDGAKNAWSAMFGYDSATKNTIRDKTENLETKGKSDKVRKKLSTIFSSIWQYYGEKDFNYAIQDEEGKELTKKKKLNANQFKFNEVATQIVSNLNGILIEESESTIKEVVSNCSNFVGPWDASHHLKNVYKEGKDNPSGQFNIDEEHSDWKRIKAMAGVCAIINEIFEPCGKKADVTKAVLDAMMPAYFSQEEMSGIQINEIDTSMYTVDMSKYDEKSVTDSSTSYEGMDKYGNPLPTNANANNKLSPLTKNLNPLMKGLDKGFGWLKENNPLEKIGTYFGNLINNSIKGLTGGFEGIEEFFKNLSSKNSSTNRGIDELSILPTNKNYWKIELDKKNPFMSGLFNFVESMNRIVKAPFSLAAASLAAGINNVQVSNSSSSSSGTTTSNQGSTQTSNTSSSDSGQTTKSSSGIASKVRKVASTIGSLFKFGKGKDEDEITGNDSGFGSDPYHIYQREYKGSFRTAGDTEKQSIADSGCGPASAASVLRMYGKKGDMHHAVNYALNNKYKEVNGGTYPEYFNSYLNKNGIKTNSNANNSDVVNNLVQGKPVILMGRDSQNSGKTPYGSKYSHYVVARGLDNKGNVIVEDSEDKNGSTRYSLADTLQNSTVRITTGRGYGRANESIADRYIGGVSGITTATISNIINNTAASLGVKFGKTNSSSNKNDSVNISGDAKAAIGKSFTATLEDKTVTLKMDESGAEIYSFLTNECGCSTAAACGVMGNWVQECGGGTIENIKPVALKGKIAEGGGLMQWTDYNGVNPHSGTWISKHPEYSSEPWSWKAQLAHVKDELTDESYWQIWRINKAASQMKSMNLEPVSSLAQFKSSTDPASAAVNFERGLEGSSDFWGDVAASEAYKGISYSHLYCFNRRLYAIAIYGLVTGQSSGSGRGNGILFPTINKKFMKNVNSISDYAISTVTSMLDKAGINTIQGNNSNSNNTTKFNGSINVDASTTIICGDSITYGLSSTSLSERAMGLSSGTTDKNQTTPAGSYESIFKSKSDIISKATDVIFFWGMNEVFTNLSPEKYFERYQDSIDTILGYGGKQASDVNIYILPVIWVPENSGYGGMYNAAAVEKFNSNYIKPFASRKGYQLIDIYEDSKKVSHNAGDVHPSDYQKLYEIIKEHMMGSGNGIFGLGNDELSSNDKISPKAYNNSNKITFGRGKTYVGKYGRAMKSLLSSNKEESSTDEIPVMGPTPNPIKTNSLSQANQTNKSELIGPVELDKDKLNGTITEESDNTETTDSTTSSDTSSTSSNSKTDATGLISLLSKYTKGLTRGIFGNFYDALFGEESDNTSINSNSDTSSASASASYNGNDVIYAAAMVFEALGKANPNSTYGSVFFDLTCRDGTKIDHVRSDCSGLMTAVLQYMGYYTYKASQPEYTDSYHGEGLSTSMQVSDFYDKEGNPTTDWEEIPASEAIGDKAKPGDIRFESGHTDMFIYYDGTNWNSRGFNAGSINAIGQSAEAAREYFNNNNTFPSDKKMGAYTIRDGTCTRVFRFKGRSASGRGKNNKENLAKLNSRIKRKNYVLDEQGHRIYMSELIAKKYNALSKYGKGKWGRAEEDETTTTDINNTPETADTTETTETASETTTTATTNTSSSSSRPAKSLISKLSKYAKAAVKGVFGNFYDALYGSEVEEVADSDGENTVGNVGNGTAGTLQNAIPYSEYGIWKQSWANQDGQPHWRNKGWSDKTVISIGGADIGSSGCSLCSTALMLVHSGVVQESTFNPGVFADDVNSRSECRDICGGASAMKHMCEYKGNTTMQLVDDHSWEFGGKSFDEIYNFVVESMQQGYFLIGHVTNHFCCIDYVDTAHKVIFIMDPGFKANCWYDGNNKPDCLDSTDIGYTMSTGPCGKRILGVHRYKSSVSNPSCYLLNGRRSFDSLHENGDAPNATITSSSSPVTNTTDETTTTGSGRGKYFNNNKFKEGPETTPGIVGDYDGTHSHRARLNRVNSNNSTYTGVLKSYDNISSTNYSNSGRGTVQRHNSSPYTNYNTDTSNDIVNNGYNTQYDNPNNLIDIIKLATVIANNSNKINDVLAVLATIAVNTENTTTVINNNNSNKQQNNSKNGLSALRTALNDTNSGEDIIKAIYQIAKS